jgi:hypothetical protein
MLCIAINHLNSAICITQLYNTLPLGQVERRFRENILRAECRLLLYQTEAGVKENGAVVARGSCYATRNALTQCFPNNIPQNAYVRVKKSKVVPVLN